MSTSFFANVTEAPPIEVFYMNKLYLDEQDSRKVNLTIGGMSFIRLSVPIYIF